MAHAVFDTVAVDMIAGARGSGHMLRANGSTLVKPGFIAVYQEGYDDSKAGDDDNDHVLPPMQEGELVKLLSLLGEQHFTEPPPRFSEASLVKALEEYGIGRPSTYASIISTLRDREYVVIDARRFTATDIGKIVNRFPDQVLHQVRGIQFHGQHGRRARRHLARRGTMDHAAREILEALHRPGR